MVVSVLDSVLDALKENENQPCLGWFLGGVVSGQTEILSVVRSVKNNGEISRSVDDLDVRAELDTLTACVPRGIQVVGQFSICGEGESVDSTVENLQKTAGELVSYRKERGDGLSDVYTGAWKDGTLILFKGTSTVNEEFSTVTKEASVFLTEHKMVKCSAELRLSIFSCEGSEDNKAGAERSVSSALKEIDSDQTVFMARLAGSSSKDKILLSASASGTSSDLFQNGTGHNWTEVSMQTLKSSAAPKSPQPVTLTYQQVAGADTHTVHCCDVGLSGLCYLPLELGLNKVGQDVLKPALNVALKSAEGILADNPATEKLESFHFALPSLPFPVSTLLLVSSSTSKPTENDPKMVDLRCTMHRRFFLPENRPRFRQACALNGVKPTVQYPGRLMDVHLAIKPSGVSGGSIGLVDGSYEYCHYMQDKFNDNGWGCAYRSFQTVFSWFVHQHYTSKQIPSHKQIQETLVDMGDKEMSFIGSKEWIGSIEVGFVLEELLDVSHRVIVKSAMQDVSAVASDLLRHFQTQGTPISIGGGVLAYTLLGVHLNQATGETAFLILDPHYTGEDDIDKIRRGGWVAWKKATDKAAAGGPLFAPNTFYNFMCPIRPKVI